MNRFWRRASAALGLLSGLLALGRAVGRDIRGVGFDDIEECALSHPPRSSVRCDQL